MKEVSDVGVGIVVVNVDDGVDPAAVADVGRPFFHVDLQNQNDNNFTRLKKKIKRCYAHTKTIHTAFFIYTTKLFYQENFLDGLKMIIMFYYYYYYTTYYYKILLQLYIRNMVIYNYEKKKNSTVRLRQHYKASVKKFTPFFQGFSIS